MLCTTHYVTKDVFDCMRLEESEKLAVVGN